MDAPSIESPSSLRLLRTNPGLRLAFLSLLATLVLGTLSFRGLVSVGSHLFLWDLVRQHPTDWDPPRVFINYLNEGPAVLLAMLGVTHIRMLAQVYSFFQFLPHALSFILCAVFTPRDKGSYLFLVFIVFSTIECLAMFTGASESNWAASIFLTLFTYLLFFEFNCARTRAGLVALGYAFISIHSYEIFAFFGTILLLFLLVRFWQFRSRLSAINKVVLSLIALSECFAIESALHSLLTFAKDRERPSLAVLLTAPNALFICSFSVASIILVILFFETSGEWRQIENRVNLKWLAITGGVLSLSVTLKTLIFYDHISTYLIWVGRILNLLFPLFLVGAVGLCVKLKRSFGAHR